MLDNRTVNRNRRSALPGEDRGSRRVAASQLRSSGFVRFLVPAVLLVMIFVDSGKVQAVMYACRDTSGSINFTNAPVNPECQVFNLEKSTRLHVEISSEVVDSASYDHDIRKIGRRYQVDPQLIKAIIHTESDFDHRAVSKRGAQGLMQLMPETARDLQVANPFNPKENIDGGTRYLRWLLDNFNGDLMLSLAAYNAGPGLVSRTGGVPRIPETLHYVNKVLKRYKAYKNQQSKTAMLVAE